MSVTPATLRSRLAAAVAHPEWREATPLELFSARTLPHKTFAVGAGDTVPAQGRPRRQPRRGEPDTAAAKGLLCSTTLTIATAYALRADARVADYDDALAAEVALVQRVADTFDETDVEAPTLVRIRRQIVDDSVAAVVTTLDWTVLHLYPFFA
jgi:hypothetical protein